mmetsp:Transcript_18960/g.62342  ORF Transcript_18960/g.62342 Transcript_18960/m.62342 type:complete len:360 (-) Transcript_18960:2860-3939(-)
MPAHHGLQPFGRVVESLLRPPLLHPPPRHLPPALLLHDRDGGVFLHAVHDLPVSRPLHMPPQDCLQTCDRSLLLSHPPQDAELPPAHMPSVRRLQREEAADVPAVLEERLLVRSHPPPVEMSSHHRLDVDGSGPVARTPRGEDGAEEERAQPALCMVAEESPPPELPLEVSADGGSSHLEDQLPVQEVAEEERGDVHPCALHPELGHDQRSFHLRPQQVGSNDAAQELLPHPAPCPLSDGQGCLLPPVDRLQPPHPRVRDQDVSCSLNKHEASHVCEVSMLDADGGLKPSPLLFEHGDLGRQVDGCPEHQPRQMLAVGALEDTNSFQPPLRPPPLAVSPPRVPPVHSHEHGSSVQLPLS